MSTLLSAPRRGAEALVVEHDPEMRERLVSALTTRGYGVRACDTLAEGRRHFDQQSVVVTHANGDTAELQGFVEFVRQAAGPTQPYILAVGEAESPSGLSQGQLGLDAFVPVPLEESLLSEQFESIAQRIALRCPTGNGGATAAGGTRPFRSAAPSMLEHFAPVLLDHLPQALAMFDTDMRYLAANRRFASGFGLDEREILGRTHFELFPDLHANWRHLFDRALVGESGRIDEDFLQRADGTSDWVRWEVRPWRESDGEIGGVILSQEVISERKREDRRRVFDRNLAVSLFESASLPMLLVGLDGRILRSSPAARAALGLLPTADGRMPFWEIYPEPSQQEEENSRFTTLSPPPADGTLGDFAPADIVVPGTPAHRLRWSASPHRSSAGETQAILLIGCFIPVARPVAPPPIPSPTSSPIPDSTATPTPPPANQTPLPTAAGGDLAQHVPFGLVQLDREGVVTGVNLAVGALLGRVLAVGCPFEPWLTSAAPEDVLREPIVREWRDNVWRRQLARTFSLASKDGLLKEIEIRPRLLGDGHLVLIMTDVTEARRAEDALRTSETKYRSLFRELPAGIALADRTGALVEGNPALEKLSGYSRVDLRRLRLADLLAFDAAPPSPASTDPRPAHLLTRNGSRLPVMVSQGAIRNPDGEPILQVCFLLPNPAPAPTKSAETAETAAPSPSPSPLAPSADATSPWRDLAFDNLRTAMLVTDLRGRIRAANPAAAQFFGVEPRALENVALFRLFRPDDPAGFSRDVSTHLNQAKHWAAETPYHDIDGRPAGTCRAEISPVNGSLVPGLLCILQPVFAPAL
ncbi:MAG: PAS domain-containing protein [Verrucomicrobiales bacterium]